MVCTTHFTLTRFLDLAGLMISAFCRLTTHGSRSAFDGDGQRIMRWGVVGFLRFSGTWSGDRNKSEPSDSIECMTTPESLELLSELSRYPFCCCCRWSSSWDPFTLSTLFMYSVGGNVWNLVVISDVRKDVFIVTGVFVPFFITVACALSNSNLRTGSWRKRFVLTIFASAFNTGCALPLLEPFCTLAARGFRPVKKY